MVIDQIREVSQLTREEVKQIVVERFNGTRSRYPAMFWKNERSLEYAKITIEYFFEQHLGWDEELIQREYRAYHFKRHGLGNMIKDVFNYSTTNALLSVYPNIIPRIFSIEEADELSEEFLKKFVRKKIVNELNFTPKNLWQCNNAREHFKVIMKYLINEIFGIEIKNIPRDFEVKTVEEYPFLWRPLLLFFDGSIQRALCFVYPNELREEDFERGKVLQERSLLISVEEERRIIIDIIEGRNRNKTPLNFWLCDRGKERFRIAIKYLFEEYLIIGEEKIPEIMNKYLLEEYGLATPVRKLFGRSYYKALNYVYPNLYSQEYYPKKVASVSQIGLEKEEIERLAMEFFEGKMKSLPSSFWKTRDKKRRLKIVTKYYIEKVRKVNPDDIPEEMTWKEFGKLNLREHLKSEFQTIFKAFNYIYPNKFQENQFLHWVTGLRYENADNLEREQVLLIANAVIEGKLQRYPIQFWSNRRSKEYFKTIFKYLIEDYLNIPLEELPVRLSNTFFEKYKLKQPVRKYFDEDRFKAIDWIYSERFQREDFSNLLGYSKPIYYLPDGEYLTEFEIRDIIRKRFHNEIKMVPKGFWKCKEGIERFKIAVKMLFEEFFGWEIQEIPSRINFEPFFNYNLYNPLKFFFNDYVEAIKFVYPGRFHPWEFKHKQKELWLGKNGKETAKEATKWLINKLNISLEEIPKKISCKSFLDNGLITMIHYLFNDSPYEAIDNLYPGTFKPWEFRVRNYWKKQNLVQAKEAVRWLVEEKLGFTKDDVIEGKVLSKNFREFKLSGLLKRFFDGSYQKALQKTYSL